MQEQISQSEKMEQLKPLISKWIQLGDDIKELKRALDDKNRQKTQIADKMKNVMNNPNGVEIREIKLKKGLLMCKKEKITRPLSNKRLNQGVREYFDEQPPSSNIDQEMIDDLVQYLLKYRVTVEKEIICVKPHKSDA